MPEKKMSTTFPIDQSAAVNFRPKAGRQMICDQQFIGGILQRSDRSILAQSFATKDQLRLTKIPVCTNSFVGVLAYVVAGEIKNKLLWFAKQGPERSRIKVPFPSPRAQPFGPLHCNFDVTIMCLNLKLQRLRVELNTASSIGLQTDRDAANAKPSAPRGHHRE